MKYIAILFLILWISNTSFSQTLQDDFSDGDFTNNPTWSGDDTEFIVNGNNELQNNGSGAATSELSTPFAIQDSTSWEFYVRMGFTPSGNNYTRVYLQSDDATLNNTSNGYYLQIGMGGSNDSIEVYRLDNGIRSRVFGGTNAAVASSPNVSFRIIRDNIGLWEVFADYTGGTNYTSEGTFLDNTYTIGTHFGFSATYTSNNKDKFFFDNIFIDTIIVDLTPPSISSITVVNNTAIDILFDEPVDLATANDFNNYTINNSVNVLSAIRDASNFRLVHLTTSALTSALQNTITINNVEDLSNNAIVNGTDNFTYYNIQAAAFQDIIINEIMADPDTVVGLPDADFIELFNRSNKIIDLGGMILNDNTTSRALPSFLLFPDSLIIITDDSDTSAYNAFGTTIAISSLALNIGGELITLESPTGQTIDSIAYTTSMYQDAAKVSHGGWTLELINPNLICQGATNWIASNDPAGGTPGQQNSVYDNTPDTQGPLLLSATFPNTTQVLLTFDEDLGSNATVLGNYNLSSASITTVSFIPPNQVLLTLSAPMIDQSNYTVTVNNVADCSGNSVLTNTSASFLYYEIQIATYQELIITEIYADPDSIPGLPDAEYLEIYNNSNKTLDLANYELFEPSRRTISSHIMRPGEYVILCKGADTLSLTGFGTVVQVSSLTLTNGGEELILKNLNGDTLDIVDYDDSWYQDNNKDGGGWSLELINFNLLCKGAANWIASNAVIGGTPGQQNSVYSNSVDTTPPSVTNIRQYGPNQILLEFDDVLNKNVAELPSSYGIDNGAFIVSVICLSDNQVILTLSNNMVDQTLYTITLNNLEDCVGNSMGIQTTSMTYYESGSANHYDIIINEIMADPNPPVGLPEKEYVELYNRSNKTFNLENFTFTDASSVTSTLPFFILHPGEYVTLYDNDDTISLSFFGNVLPVGPFPDLNTSDELLLQDQSGEVIDAVAYELSWYQNSDKSTGGWSLERINPERPCEAADNWRASENILGGTPSSQNSVFDTAPDVQSPDALRAFPLSPTSIRLYFSEAIADLAGATASNYTIDNGINVLTARLEPPFYNTAILTLDQALVLGTTYIITMDVGLTDCVGNPIALNNTARVALPQDIEQGDFILNEVLFNPVTSGKDFVELYNTSNKVLNTADLVFSNAEIIDGNLANAPSIQTRPVEVNWLVFPNEYVVITEDPDQVRGQYSTPNPALFVENDLPTFSDSEGSVFLYAAYDSSYVDNQGNSQVAYLAKVMDLFEYSDDFHSPLIDDKNGVSLERIDFDAPTNDANNWHSAATEVGYATPAYQNSSFYANDLSGDDLIQLPTETVSPDGDGYEDFLLINYNVDDLGYVANIDIYDATGRLIRNLVNGELLAREGSLQWDGTNNQGKKARVGIHILALEIFRPDGTVKRFKKTCIVAGRMN